MKYICTKHFIGPAIDGDVDINIGAELVCEDRILYHDSKKICISTSENAHIYFMRNDDGNGRIRGELISTIKNSLSKNPDRWDKIYADPICQAYRIPNHNVWLWNHAFYNTSIYTLAHIKSLVDKDEV